MKSLAKQLGQEMVIQNITDLSVHSRVIINLDDTPVDVAGVLRAGSKTRSTNGVYFLKYRSEAALRARGNRVQPYTLYIDLLPFAVYLMGEGDLKRASKIFPEVAWVLRNTNFDPMLFDIAKAHPGMPFYFSVNFAEYYKKIKEKADALNLNMGLKEDQDKPFVVYKRSQPNDIEFCAKLTKESYDDQLLEYKEGGSSDGEE